MKKIIKTASWNTDDFTVENISTKSHWFAKLWDAALTALDIGSFSMSYASINSVNYIIVTTANYGEFKLSKPAYYSSTPYIAYIDSENKELLMCASMETAMEPTLENITTTDPKYANFLRSCITSSSGSGTRVNGYGGLFAYKFTNGTVIGFSDGTYMQCYTRKGSLYSQIGCVLPDRKSSLVQPVISTKMFIARKPILDNLSGITTFRGLYFNSIYDTDKYYLGSMKTADNKFYYYNGFVFAVDDARDIETV